MASILNNSVELYYSLREAEYNLPRRRFQQNPKLYIKDGHWKFRYYADRIVNGKLARYRPEHDLGPAPPAKGALTERQAERAKQDFLTKHDREDTKPTSLISFRDYYLGEYHLHLTATSDNNQIQAESIFRLHILPNIGDMPMKDVSKKHVQALITQKSVAGLSYETVRHIRKHVSSVFNHAIEDKIITDNPAAKITLPEYEKRNPTPGLTFEKAAFVILELPELYAAMSVLAFCCSANVAEMTGLKWKRLNLTGETRMVEDQFLPPGSAWIAQNWTKRKYKSTKTIHRGRIIPLPDVLVDWLVRWQKQTAFNGPDDPVFAARLRARRVSTIDGNALFVKPAKANPIDYNNANNRIFKRLSYAVEVDFTWNSFRHSFRAFCDVLHVPGFRRKLLMGHSLKNSGDMGDVYGHSTFDELRAIVNEIAERIQAARALNRDTEATDKVVAIR